jgi:chaperone modulatory protein CbpM
MNIVVSESIRLDESGVCSIEHLAELSGLSLAELHDLVESGVIEPVQESAEPFLFYLRYVVTAKTARRLRDDFELDRRGVAVALTLLDRIERLEQELRNRR